MKDKAVGICLGASTISAVELTKKGDKPTITRVILRAHKGNPRVTFQNVLDELNCNRNPILVTGRKFRSFVQLPSIIEPEAVEYALDYVFQGQESFDALVSAGGETFMVYQLNGNGQIIGISTGNKCASGTGEFFLQQIRRMSLGVDEAVGLARFGTSYAVSGRCSVFCKSDCTHALNKGQPVSNVTAGLCEMISSKIHELLAKVPHSRTLIVGGVALNTAVIDNLRQRIDSLVVPEEAAYFEALGAALRAFEKGKSKTRDLLNLGRSSFAFLSPLRDFESFVTFGQINYGKANQGDRCIIGLDVGSTTTKAVLLRTGDNAILYSEYLRTEGNPVEASRACFKSLSCQLGGIDIEIVGIGVTGSGRKIAGFYALTEGVINEIIAHSTGAVHFDPEVDTIFEIGGQDAKYTYLTNSVASDYAMNEACSAGTGSFLEESAYESLGVRMEDIAPLALKGKRPPNFNDQCAAFISSDIKNAAHEGLSTEDILAGLVYSICFNYINRVKGNRPVGKKIFMQGGVCYNRAVPLALAGILKKPIVVPPEPGLIGAFGVALELKKRMQLGLIQEKEFDLDSIIKRNIEYEEPFNCGGGKDKCDLKCSINRIRIDGKIFPFGGACDRYYNLQPGPRVDSEKLDLVRVMNKLVFEKYSPEIHADPQAPKIGVSTSFLTNRLFPLYYNFFSRLGCRVVMPDRLIEEAFNRQRTSMCFPAQIALGLFQDLLNKEPDYIFMPHLQEMYVPGGIDRKDFCAACILVQGEAFWMRQAFKDYNLREKMIAPTLNFNGGWEKGRKVFVEVAQKLGFAVKKAEAAFDAALDAQIGVERECQKQGMEALKDLEAHPEQHAIVIFGRVYNAYSNLANKGIPKKLTSRGNLIIPFDFLPYEEEPLDPCYREYMHWAAGQRILRSAQIVKKNDQLFGVYITNFLCGPDSFLISYFRRIMGTKPSLTLELDAHTADTGINTRIEAFLDIIRNYLEVKGRIQDPKSDFRPAYISGAEKGMKYVDSQGRHFRFTDPQVRLILPSMGDLGTSALAMVFNRLNIRTTALPVADNEALRLGRSVTTGKECLPMHICIGSLIRYLEHRDDPNEKLMMFLPKAGGYCRLGQYHVYTNQFIREKKLQDVALITPAAEENFLGLGINWSLWAWRACVASDVMDDIRNGIYALAEDVDSGMELFAGEYGKIMQSLRFGSGREFYAQLEKTAAAFKRIPLKMAYHRAPHIELTGEIFVRKEAFSNLGIVRRLTGKGFVVTVAAVGEWINYINYLIRNRLIEPRFTLWGWIDFFVTFKVARRIERKIRRIMSASGLCSMEPIDIDDLMRYKNHVIPKALAGEHDLITAVTLRDSLTKYCGIVSVGPFGCMQSRFGESIVMPQTDVKAKLEAMREAGVVAEVPGFKENDRIPFLFIESDGNPYPQLLEARFENFCLQAARVAQRQGKDTAGLILS